MQGEASKLREGSNAQKKVIQDLMAKLDEVQKSNESKLSSDIDQQKVNYGKIGRLNKTDPKLTKRMDYLDKSDDDLVECVRERMKQLKEENKYQFITI